MQEFIVEETTKIFNKAIKRFAKKEGVEEQNVSILLSLNEEKKVEYTLCVNYEPKEKLTIKEVLGVKMDLKQYSVIVPPQIKNILLGFEEEQKSSEVEVGVYINPKEEDEILYFLFKEGSMVRGFELTDVLKIKL